MISCFSSHEFSVFSLNTHVCMHILAPIQNKKDARVCIMPLLARGYTCVYHALACPWIHVCVSCPCLPVDTRVCIMPLLAHGYTCVYHALACPWIHVCVSCLVCPWIHVSVSCPCLPMDTRVCIMPLLARGYTCVKYCSHSKTCTHVCKLNACMSTRTPTCSHAHDVAHDRMHTCIY